MYTTLFSLPMEEDENVTLPTFTFTHTLSSQKREPLWARAKDVVAALRAKGVSTTTQTLFNMARRGQLHPRQAGPRQNYFDMHEINKLFDIEQ